MNNDLSSFLISQGTRSSKPILATFSAQFPPPELLEAGNQAIYTQLIPASQRRSGPPTAITTTTNMASTTERKDSTIENNNTSPPVTASACPQVPKQYSIYGYNTYAMIRPPTSGPVTAGSGPLNGVNHHQNGPLYSQPPPPLPYRPPPPNPYNTPPSSYNGRGGIPMQGKMDKIACTQIELSFFYTRLVQFFPNYKRLSFCIFLHFSRPFSCGFPALSYSYEAESVPTSLEYDL